MINLLHGDALDQLRALPDDHFDALFCDPPYGLSFMGKKWDYDVPSVELWREALRVLKPGAPLLAFGGSRTYHRMTVNIEDAGFEIRDCIQWLYGSGFPKSMALDKAIDKKLGAERPVVGEQAHAPKFVAAENGGFNDASREVFNLTAPATEQAKAWEGWGTALKPAYEPVIVAMKPVDGTFADNALQYGVGGLNIDACRIGEGTGKPKPEYIANHGNEVYGKGMGGGAWENTNGRWPANVILDDTAAAVLDEQSGVLTSGARTAGVRKGMGFHGADGDGGPEIKASKGGASRFFYVAKASRAERDAGLQAFASMTGGGLTDREDGSQGLNSPRAGAGRTSGGKNTHPTVKPLKLLQYLATLILPPARDGESRRILVPFAGSGSECIGALQAGWEEVTGIEREAEYIAIAHARVAHWITLKDTEAA